MALVNESNRVTREMCAVLENQQQSVQASLRNDIRIPGEQGAQFFQLLLERFISRLYLVIELLETKHGSLVYVSPEALRIPARVVRRVHLRWPHDPWMDVPCRAA